MALNKDRASLEEKNRDYEKKLIISLDLDFLHYLKQLEFCRQQLCLESERELVQLWCDKLLSEKRTSIVNKRRRNIFLAQLILAIKENRLSFSPVFSKPPQPLSSYTSVFGFTPASHNIPSLFTVEKRNITDLSDYIHFSENMKTYLATKALPDGAGFMAYVGLAVGSTPDWLDHQGDSFFENNKQNERTACSTQSNQNPVKSRTYKEFVNNNHMIKRSACEDVKDGTTFHIDLLRKVEKSLNHIDVTQCIPLNEDDNVICIMDRLQKKLVAKKSNRLAGLSSTQRYYEMLKLIKKSILSKLEALSQDQRTC